MIIKRLTIWLVETIAIVVLLGLGWWLVVDQDQARGISRDILLAITWIGLFAFSTGYLLTTAISRTIWKDLRLWSYPLIAVALFFIHSQICFITFGTLNEAQRLALQIPGSLTVFACTFAGGLGLRRWILGQ